MYISTCVPWPIYYFIFADIDVHSGVVQTQAGVVLEKLDAQLGEHGLMAPLDLGAKGRFFSYVVHL